MSYTKVSFTSIKDANKEGLVFYGCGGDLKDWVVGITKELFDSKIIASIDTNEFFDVKVLTTSGNRIDLVFVFKEDVKIDLGKLAIWRLKFGGCSWISDYIVNYAYQHNN